MRPLILLTYQRRVFEPTHELVLPDGWPLPRVGEQVVPPGSDDGDPPYRVLTVEHVFDDRDGAPRILVVAHPDDWWGR